MKQYRLKKNQPSYEVVDGPLAGKSFAHGHVYNEIPPGDAKKFEIVRPLEPKKGSKNSKSAAPAPSTSPNDTGADKK